MATIKFTELLPFDILMLLGGSFNGYKYSERLSRLFMEIQFKFKAVNIAYDLVQKQEKVLRLKHSKNFQVASYKEEVRQLAYLSYFFDAVYALTEKISEVNRIFHQNLLPKGFNKQRDKLISKSNINKPLARLMTTLKWYDLFREVRVESSHWGTSILAYGYDKKPQNGSSQLIIELAPGGREKKVLTPPRYNFNVREVQRIKEGIPKFLQDWSFILIKKLAKNVSIGKSKAISIGNWLKENNKNKNK